MLAGALCASGCRAALPDGRFSCSDQRDCPLGLYCDTEQSLCTHVKKRRVVTRANAAQTATAGDQADAQAGNAGAGAGAEAPDASIEAGATAGAAGVASTAGGGSGGAGAPAAASGNGSPMSPPAQGCMSGATRCSGFSLERCASDSTKWQELEHCPNGCNAARLRCNACPPGRLPWCSGGVVESCAADGSEWQRKTCSTGCRRDGTGCLECASAEHACDALCVSNTSPDTCGTRCEKCPEPLNTVPLCQNGGCGYACKPSYGSCNRPGDGCEPLSWDFEVDHGTWFVPSGGEFANVLEALELSSAQRHGGAKSAKAAVEASGESRSQFLFATWLCGTVFEGGQSFDVSGKTMRIWINVAPRGGAGSAHKCMLTMRDISDASENLDEWVPMPNNRWTSLSHRWTSSGARNAQYLGLNCILDVSTPWSGDIYIDDITLQ